RSKPCPARRRAAFRLPAPLFLRAPGSGIIASGAPRRLTPAESAPLLRPVAKSLRLERRRRRGLRRIDRVGDPGPALLRARARDRVAARSAGGDEGAAGGARAQTCGQHRRIL